MAHGRTKPSRLQRTQKHRIGLRPGEELKPHELRAISRGTRPELIASNRQISRTLLEDKKLRNEVFFKHRLGRIKDGKSAHGEKGPQWNTRRTFSYYNKVFSAALGEPLLSLLERVSRRKRLRILEDGAGDIKFLRAAKKKLARRGIKAETTAVVLHKTPRARLTEERGEVDRVIETPAEFILPEGKFDAIISVSGGIEYAEPKLKRHLIEKYCYALEKGGIALINMGWLSGVKEEAVIKRLEKLGFKAEFFRVNDLAETHPDLPEMKRKYYEKIIYEIFMPNILIIRRKR